MFQVQFEDKRYGVEFDHDENFEHYYGRGRTTCTIKSGFITCALARTYCSSLDKWRYAKGEKESLKKALGLLKADKEMRTAFWNEYFLVHDRLRQSRKWQKAEREQAGKDTVALEKLKRYCVKHNTYFSLNYWGYGAAQANLAIPAENEPCEMYSAVGDTISEAADAVFEAVEELGD